MARRTTERVPAATLTGRIEAVGQELRDPLRTLIEDLGGVPPRPTGLVRSIGLDKSLAGRIVRAVRADSDLEFMHLVPSPSGLRILLDRARETADPQILEELEDGMERFRQLLDSTPGGRDAIDAQISESSREVREKSEHVAKQASFKSMSFLLGHFCEILSSTLLIVPSEDGRHVDGIEVSTRIGVQRMRPTKSLALLSVFTNDEAPEDGTFWVESLNGGSSPTDFLLPEFSTDPLPNLDVDVQGEVMTFLLGGDPSGSAPKQLSSALWLRNGWPRTLNPGQNNLRGYVLTLPARVLVRDIFVAEELYPGAIPSVSFSYPIPGGFVNSWPEGRCPDFSSLELTAPIEQLPTGPRRHEIAGVPNHQALVSSVLEKTGHENTAFRGWRCSLSYPVSFVEMVWSLRLPERAS